MPWIAACLRGASRFSSGTLPSSRMRNAEPLARVLSTRDVRPTACLAWAAVGEGSTPQCVEGLGCRAVLRQRNADLGAKPVRIIV